MGREVVTVWRSESQIQQEEIVKWVLLVFFWMQF